MNHRNRPCWRALVFTLAVFAGRHATPAFAQTAPPKSDSSRARPLFGVRDLAVAVGFTGVTIAMFPLDERIERHLAEPQQQSLRGLHHLATGVEIMASPGVYVASAVLYVGGRLGHLEGLADVGWHTAEAVVLADGITLVLKGVAGRARPFSVADTLPNDFSLGRGFTSSDHQSFPSGHTSTAFSAAAAATAESGRVWPGSAWIVGPVLYGGATLVGLSRMYHNKHWASDVALGAAIGTFSGIKVVQYSHSHHTRLDQIFLHTSASTDGHNLRIGWSGAFR